MKHLICFLALSSLLYSCTKSEDPINEPPKTNPDKENYLVAEVDNEGKIIVRHSPKDYVLNVDKGQHTLSVRIPDNYYSSASSLSGTELKATLKTIITTGAKQLQYTSSTSSDVWDMCEAGDENPSNSNEVWLIYTEKSMAKTYHSSGSDGWNREHVWAKSHGDLGTSPGPGTDGHHLRASDAQENGKRGNLDFDDVNGPRTKNSTYYEPPLSAKGDVARSIFYMALRYGYMVDNGSGSGARHGKLETLLKWNELDPVDPYEIRRNNVIFQFQNNRNPFIDHPELVKYIYGYKQDNEWIE